MILLDLTARQCARVIEQALRQQCAIEIEPRTWPQGSILRGAIAARERTVVRVDLADGEMQFPLGNLVGAFCDVRMILSGQMYHFSTCIVDVLDMTTPRRLLLATPECIQVANRRRFIRQAPDSSVMVSIRVDEPGATHVGELANIGPDGLACRVNREEVDPVLMIGDSVRLVFEIPGDDESYDLFAAVCNKGACDDRAQLVVGFEFDHQDPNTRSTLQRLRAVLFNAAPGTSEADA